MLSPGAQCLYGLTAARRSLRGQPSATGERVDGQRQRGVAAHHEDVIRRSAAGRRRHPYRSRADHRSRL